MKRMVLRQLMFLIFLALILVLIMGIAFITTARAQTLDSGSNVSVSWDISNDEDEWDWEDNQDWMDRASSIVRYNRVEGLFLGIRVHEERWRAAHVQYPFLYGCLGWAFSAKEFEYQIGLEKNFFRVNTLGFGGEYHRVVDTPDHWFIDDMENSIAAFLLKEDFQDFYLREGASGYIRQNITSNLTLEASYVADRIDSLDRNATWSLFGRKKHFRENPDMTGGDSLNSIRSLKGRVVLDTRNSRKAATRGWYLEAEWEHAGNGLDGDFNFDRLLVDLRRFQPLGFGDGLDVHLRLGSSHGSLPWVRSYQLGGIGTMRGFPYKSLSGGPMRPGGNRMVLAQVEYRIGRQRLPDEMDLGLIDRMYFIVFTDLGWVDEVGDGYAVYEGFDNLSGSTMKNDVGIALSNRRGDIRLEVCRRTDTGHKPFVVAFRLRRTF